MKTRFRLIICLVLLLAISTSLMGLSAGADYSYYLSTAETCNETIVFQFYTHIIEANFMDAQGSFAPGLQYSFDDTFIYISGRPTSPGKYSLNGKASTLDGSYENYSFTIIVEDAGGTQVPVPTQAPMAAPLLTKSPTDETVIEGNSAMFIARADNANSIEWYLVEKGTYSSYTLRQAASQLEGLSYSGQGTEVLELYNIPIEMDGWQVECAFTNGGGTTISDPATVYVNELQLVNPGIKTQPQGAEKDMDSAVILSVIADNNTEGSQLKYQWYMSSTGSGNLNPISGANSSSYTPPKTEGTVYYTVAVWSSLEGRDSGKTYSNPAAVTFTDKASTPTPSPSASPAPSTAPSAAPSPSTTPDNKREDEGGFGIIGILIIAMLLSAALVVVILVILRKNAKEGLEAKPLISIPKLQHKEEIKAAEKPMEPVQPKPVRIPREWQCSCGALNNSPFCTQCGRARPVLKPCAKCGWMPESINNVPHFCPECGSPFEEEQE